jgi:hypothetical protein
VKTIFFFLISLAFYSQDVEAQTIAGQSIKTESLWKTTKKSTLSELMQFDDDEARAFWPLYESYMKDWCRLMEHRIYQILYYCHDSRNPLPTTYRITDDLLTNDARLARLQKKTYKKVRHILSAPRATRFMQLEYSMQLALLIEMQQMMIRNSNRNL